jgi:hypothetical protein
MIKVNQHVFDLANGRVTPAHRAVDQFFALALPANAVSSMPGIGLVACALRDRSLCVC